MGLLLLMKKDKIVALSGTPFGILVFRKKLMPVGSVINKKYTLNSFIDSKTLSTARKNHSYMEMYAPNNLHTVFNLAQANLFVNLDNDYWAYPLSTIFSILTVLIRRRKYWWKEINYFTNSFDEGFGTIMINDMEKSHSVKTPDCTTSGDALKTWIIQKGERYLIKADMLGGFDAESQMKRMTTAKELNQMRIEKGLAPINLLEYKLCGDGDYDCICKCFTDENHEFVRASDMLAGNTSGLPAIDALRQIVKINNIPGGLDYIDFLIELSAITGRKIYLDNIGFIRHTESLKYITSAPIFGR